MSCKAFIKSGTVAMIVFFVVLIIPLFALAKSDEKATYQEYLSGYDFSFFDRTLDKETREYLKELKADNFDYQALSNLTAEDAAAALCNMLLKHIKKPLTGGVCVIVYLVFSAMIAAMKSDCGSDLNGAFSTVSAVAIALLLTANVGTTLSLCSTALGVAGNFIYAFLPVFCAIVLASGKSVTAFSVNSSLLMLAQGISFLASNLFMPVVNSLLALGICCGLREELQLDKLLGSLKNGLIWCLSFISGAFVCVLSLKTTVAARADVLGLRSARFVINSVVPVIGGSVSEGLLTIQSYSSLIKSSVGVVGIIAIALVFLPPIFEVTAWRGVLSVCGAVADVFDCRSVTKVMNSFRYALLVADVLLILSALTTVVSIGLTIASGD